VSDATAAVVEQEYAHFEPLDEADSHRHLLLRTDRDIELMVADLLALLDLRLERA
jgi:hypothetical protein